MIRALCLLLLACAPLAMSAAAAGSPDPRICYVEPEQIPRSADGSIRRSQAVRAVFARLYPCPSTGLARGPCPGWQVDHVIPLACGGCDAIANMQWLPVASKSAGGADAKDRWERRVYCRGPQ